MRNFSKTWVIICIVFFPNNIQAQIRVGACAGVNFANAFVSNLPDGFKTVLIPSFHIGGIGEYSLNKNFAIETGLIFSGKGTKVEDSKSLANGSTTYIYSPYSLDIPVNVMATTGSGKVKLELFAGVYTAFGISGKVKTIGLTTETRDLKFGNNAEDDLKGKDFGINLGAGVEINHFQIRGGCSIGLINLNPDSTSILVIRSNIVEISAAYLFGKKF